MAMCERFNELCLEFKVRCRKVLYTGKRRNSSDTNETILPKEPQQNKEDEKKEKENNMERLRQFGLLLRKDLILVKRNKVWTVFELVLPALLLSAIIYPVVKNASTQPSPEVKYDSFPLHGTIEDVFYAVGYTKSIYQRWCLKSDVLFGYTVKDPDSIAIVDRLMKNLAEKYQDKKLRLNVTRSANEGELLQTLKNDMPLHNETFCVVNKYVGGVAFDTIDTAKKIMKYRIFIGMAKEENWHLTDTWDTPYGPGSGRNSRIPSEPPYWSSGFLSLQHALETTFVEIVKGSEVPDAVINFQGLPDPRYTTSTVSTFIEFFPFIFAFLTFINVVHITREIAAENGSVKPFLTAMGLSTSMFYLAHIVVAFVKFLIIFLITAIPLLTVLEYVSPSALLLSLFLYGAGAVTFGAFIASFFENTNSAIKAILVAWGAMLGIAWKLLPKTSQISACFLYALNINGAFTLAIEAISDYMKRERELNIFNMFSDSSLQFSLGWALFMMIFDVIWMWTAAMIVDHIRTSADFTLRTLFSKKERLDEYENQTDGVTAHNTRVNEQMNTIGSSSLSPPNVDSDALLEGSTEIDGARDHARADISVSKLVKIWSTTGERAVDGLSLRAMRGQVSILLGHNGAGKSTTFASIAGIIKPTYGSVTICGNDVVKHASKTRKHVGLCPQYNPLYEKLTVEEHLWLVNGLKGAKKTGFKSEMDRLLKDVKLDFKKDALSMNLSGGMKRKLCVCMALIGESEVILLDEPTAGMDPGARKDVQELLEREKNNRTILLTTHYMDEAERLGDWIFIMSHGRLVASGTNQYLKQKFGTGFLLTVVLDHNGDKRKMAEVLTGVCQHFVEGAERGDLHGQQVEVILPEKKKHNFVDLFRGLEAIQERDFKSDALSSVPNQLKSQLATLMMTNFGLSLNTLEQVFITIGDKVDEVMASRQNSRVSHHRAQSDSNSLKPPGYDTQSSTKSADSYQRLMDSQARGPEKRGASKVIAQFVSIIRKKFLYSVRNWTQLFGQVVIPLILLGLVASLSTLKSTNTDQVRSLTIEHLEPTKVVWRFDDENVPPRAESILNMIKKVPGFEVLKYSQSKALINITQSLIGEMPPAGFGLTIDDRSDNIVALFNNRAYHVLPTLISLINRARLSADTAPIAESTIESGIWLYSKDDSESNLLPSNLIDVLLTPMLILIFAMVTSTFVMFLIEERESMFAHQQFLTGISPVTFYSASFFYDFVLYAIICVIFLFIFLAFKWMVNHFAIVLLFWFLYFISSVPFIYAVSFLFASPSKANVMLIIWQVIISGTALIAVFILFTLIPMNVTIENIVKNLFLFLLPSYAFGSAILTINTYGQILSNEQLMEWDMIGKNAVLMLTFGIISFALFVALQFKPIRKALSQVWTIRRTGNNNVQPFMPDLPHCDSVDRERDLVHGHMPRQYALVVKDLTKQFGKMTAVNELCLAVDQKECFGLLGVNGAGKTTTFNILTGQSFATSGDATIGGRDVTEQVAIGYCPQFDALLLDLTGRECLEILAQMHGFSNYKAKADLVLECVGMLNHADKLVRFYSGGQKRKISVGVALLAPTQMIILDEPTAGIDPKARREVWELLLWCREHSNSALMLTSHSMDECEALCSRIAVLNRGSLIAIGTSQDLKSLYGNNYTMTLSLNHIDDRESICKLVSEHLPYAVLKTTKTNKTLNLRWQIPKSPGDRWSDKFEMVQQLAKVLNVKDYILAQSSLEETFLRLAGLDDDKDQTDHATLAVM